MDAYAGIPLSEMRLLVETIVFTLLFMAALVAFAVLCYTYITATNKKERQHLKRLKERAKTDDLAARRLEKRERKQQARRKRNRRSILYDALIGLLSGGLCLALLLLTVIPGWTDYCRKDYVVYTGEIRVYNAVKRSRILLPDGTTVWGRGDFDADDTYGTLVYAKRSKILVGTQK